MNNKGKIIAKSNITIDNLGCTFRQNSDGPYLNLISEIDPTRFVTFDTIRLLMLNPNLHRRYFLSTSTILFPREQCRRFMFDSQIDENLLNRKTNLFKQ